MNDAAICNNQGVDLYRQLRLLEARAHFRAAAKRLLPIACGGSSHAFLPSMVPARPALHSGNPTQAVFENCHQSLSSPFEIPTSFDTSQANSSGSSYPGPTNDEVDHDSHLLFVREAHVMLDDSTFPFGTQNGQHSTTNSPPTNDLCSLHTAGIIMNIALTYIHEHSEQSLRFSLHLFEIAYILILQQQHNSHSSPSAGAERIALTCLNNAAQILCNLGNHSLSQLYLTTLVQYMRQLPIDPQRACWRGRFLLHAVILQGSSAASAA